MSSCFGTLAWLASCPTVRGRRRPHDGQPQVPDHTGRCAPTHQYRRSRRTTHADGRSLSSPTVALAQRNPGPGPHLTASSFHTSAAAGPGGVCPCPTYTAVLCRTVCKGGFAVC